MRKVGSLEHFSEYTQEQGVLVGPASRIGKADALSFGESMKVRQPTTAMSLRAANEQANGHQEVLGLSLPVKQEEHLVHHCGDRPNRHLIQETVYTAAGSSVEKYGWVVQRMVLNAPVIGDLTFAPSPQAVGPVVSNPLPSLRLKRLVTHAGFVQASSCLLHRRDLALLEIKYGARRYRLVPAPCVVYAPVSFSKCKTKGLRMQEAEVHRPRRPLLNRWRPRRLPRYSSQQPHF